MKKKIWLFLSAVILCCIMLSVNVSAVVWDGTAASGFAGGTGTEDDPYQIATAEQLAYLAQSVNSGTTYAGQYIKLTADIVLNNTSAANWKTTAKKWTPIGTSSKPFSGTFDGSGHAIRGLYISTSTDYQGLFGYVSNAFIHDLTIEESYVIGGTYVGALVGYVNYDTQFTNCTNNADVSAVSSASAYAGGIVGYCKYGILNNCTNRGTVTAYSSNAYAGGIAGYGDPYGYSSPNTSFINCTNEGTISSSSSSASSYAHAEAGGIAGKGESFTNCINYGDISATGSATASAYAGGIAGYGSGVFENCANSGNISATGYFTLSGGIAGESGDIFRNCTNSGTVFSEDTNAGGIAGRASDYSVFEDCSNSGDIAAPEGTAAGISANDGITFTNCINRGNISGGYSSGGIVGDCDYVGAGYYNVTITNCTNEGAVSVSSPQSNVSDHAGGIAGRFMTSAVVENCTNKGTVSGGDSSGGIVGDCWNHDSSATFTFIYCKNEGNISCDYTAGGIIGEWDLFSDPFDTTLTFENCTNSGDVSTISSGAYTGGIAGKIALRLSGASVTCNFKKCTNSGEISAKSLHSHTFSGGIAGYCASFYSDAAAAFSFENCLNRGAVLSYSTSNPVYTGGIVGCSDSNSETSVYNCFNTGLSSGSGIAGNVSSGTISCCYTVGSAGDAAIVSSVGTAEVTNCYYLTGYAQEDEKGTALTEEQMRQRESFVGFNFADTWTMEGSEEYLYPELQSVTYTGGSFTPVPLFAIITAQPVSVSCFTTDTPSPLSVTASCQEGDILTYQWYVSDRENSSFTAIPGATEASYTPPDSSAGVKYYYVVITNNLPDGVTVMKSRSKTVSVSFVIRVDAAVPTITQQPEAYLHCVAGNDAPELVVSAVIPDGGNLSYQWYVNAENSTTGGTPIEGATAEKYTPSTTEAGIRYYYVTVTNTNPGVNGTKTASAVSDISIVFVVERVDAAAPVISAQPQSAVYTLGDEATSLRVSAQISDTGTLSYQWYANTVNAVDGGTEISGAVSAEFTPPTDVPGTVYYYVVVTNTNSSVNGTKSVSVISDTAYAFVKYNAALPLITNEPASGEYVEQQSIELSVTAEGDSLTYQWYVNTEDSTDNGTAIPGAENAVYNFVPDYVGVRYYYVRITNSDPEATGEKTGSVFSRPAAIRVLPLVHASEPTITSQPLSAAYTVDYPSEELSVTAAVTDGGTLSYQWYVSLAENAEGTAIPGANDSRYTPPTDTVGVQYYYAVVTNTNPQVTGTKSVSVSTNTVSIQIIPKVDAVTPVIEKQPLSGVYTVGGAIENLSITASVTDGGTLYYQWYTNTANKNTGGTPIEGAVHASYTPENSREGLVYYYVVITNRNEQATGVREVSITSNCAAIILTPATLAATPIISCHPENAVYTAGAAPAVLSVIASVSDGGSLSYQWFSNTTNSNVGGTAITGATAASYTPSTASVGTFYYYVVVTNTNDKVTGEKSVSVASSVVSVTVNPKLYTIRGSITSFGEGDVTIALLKDCIAVESVTITVTANSYEIADVPTGIYILRISKPKHVTREYMITVGNP